MADFVKTYCDVSECLDIYIYIYIFVRSSEFLFFADPCQ